MRYLFTSLLLLAYISSGAQELSGYVYDSVTHKPLSPVTVVNQTTNNFAFTDDNGKYTIIAKPGEMIGFSYIGYKNVEYPAPAGLGNHTLSVNLKPSSVQLQEFTLRPGKLTQFQIDSIERVQTYKLQLERQRASVLSPASALAELFSKKDREIFKFQKQFKYYESQKFVDTRYTPELVTAVTGLTGDTVGYFMNSYPMRDDYARNATDLELKMWIRSNYKAWMKDSANHIIPKIKEAEIKRLDKK